MRSCVGVQTDFYLVRRIEARQKNFGVRKQHKPIKYNQSASKSEAGSCRDLNCMINLLKIRSVANARSAVQSPCVTGCWYDYLPGTAARIPAANWPCTRDILH